jgi:hypothetical protein
MLQRLINWIVGLPRWARPAVVGATGLAFIVAFRMVLLLPAMLVQPHLLLSALGVLVLAVAAGALGGLAYTVLGRRLLFVPWVGRYVAGILCVAAYLLPVLLIIPRLLPLSPSNRGAFDLHDRAAQVVWLTCTLFFGVVVGRTFFDPVSRGAPGRRHASRRDAV